MDIQEPEFTSEQVRSVLFTQDAGNQSEPDTDPLTLPFPTSKENSSNFTSDEFHW
ncbi:hypothetical protein ANCCEY_15287 [Ancylostoma ceylanicum]|uniref:Uncharacterized protein n=1 Tax=Ancylostoma ceylanicum TaxID=53326 RepID=A0A0D6L7T6_9BILA|nr:hypothetical protein ANCCEY_15287 [Ancylostoma ceylanicum]